MGTRATIVIAFPLALSLLSGRPAVAQVTQCERFLSLRPGERILYVGGVIEGVNWAALDLRRMDNSLREEDPGAAASASLRLLSDHQGEVAKLLRERVEEVAERLATSCRFAERGLAQGSILVALTRVIDEVYQPTPPRTDDSGGD